MKDQDIQIPANSLAERALQGTSTLADNRRSHRLSVRGIFGPTNTENTAGAGAGAEAEEAEILPEKKVDGREIKQVWLYSYDGP